MIIANIIIVINPSLSLSLSPMAMRAQINKARHASSPNVNRRKRDRNALSPRLSSGESISFYYYDRELTRCNGERRQMTHLANVTYIHTYVTYIHMYVYIYICTHMYTHTQVHTRTCAFLVTRVRREGESSLQRSLPAIASRLPLLLHYSSPK